jgi:hypothetical protein
MKPNKDLQAKLRKRVDVSSLEQTSKVMEISGEQLACYLADLPLSTSAFRAIEGTLASLPEASETGVRRLPTQKPSKRLQAELRKRIEESSLEQVRRELGITRLAQARYLADIAMDTLSFLGLEVILKRAFPEASAKASRR